MNYILHLVLLLSILFSQEMNVISGLFYTYTSENNIMSAEFYTFHDPIPEDISLSANGEIFEKERTYHHNGPLGGFHFYQSLLATENVEIEISGDLNIDYTMPLPSNIIITSPLPDSLGNYSIDPSEDFVIEYTAENYDFFYYSYYIHSLIFYLENLIHNPLL